ncbi:hypothetical protein [Burkholderia ubonensis]|uniref:hypothetical protein n=1 Tax=Burkholderia ubonensis TaxID=101571 RepID=UPI000A999975|nr:hypothetical protein [Burkholderia ubonensis]
MGLMVIGKFVVMPRKGRYEVFPMHGIDNALADFDDFNAAKRWAPEANDNTVQIDLSYSFGRDKRYAVDIVHPRGALFNLHLAEALSTAAAQKIARNIRDIYLEKMPPSFLLDAHMHRPVTAQYLFPFVVFF